MRGAKARAVYDPAADAVALTLSPYPGATFVWPHPELQVVDTPQAAEPPSHAQLRISEDAARALYEALSRYFGGDVVDARRLRDDYDAERRRVDKFIDALIQREAS